MAVMLRRELILLALIFFSPTLLAAKSAEQSWLKDQKLTRIQFFLHEFTNPPNKTIAQVAPAATTSQSPSSFGRMFVMDDLLTTGPDIGSELIGRAQGLTAAADQHETSAILMATNFVFTAGEYNGSTLTMLGRNRLTAPVRELPIVGGTGVFRFARGFVVTRTLSIDQKNGVVNTEYNVSVLRY